MSRNHYFKPKMPKGSRVFYSNFQVALASEYGSQIDGLVGAKQATFKLEAEPKNKYDPNAILLTATKKGLLWTSNLILGYLPKEIAAEVTQMELVGLLVPRPKEVWRGDRGGFSFVVDLIGPKSAYKDFDKMNKLKLQQEIEAAANQPATPLQKEYYKFFGVKFAKGTTSGEADEFIRKHSDLLTRSGDKRLDYWTSFLNLWELLCDPEVRREDLEIMKPSLSLAIKTFGEWVKEDDFSKDDLEDEAEFVDRLLEQKPDLRLGD